MYVLVGIHPTKNMDFFGPFPSEERAMHYAREADKNYEQPLKWVVRPLVVPHFVMPIRFIGG